MKPAADFGQAFDDPLPAHFSQPSAGRRPVVGFRCQVVAYEGRRHVRSSVSRRSGHHGGRGAHPVLDEGTCGERRPTGTKRDPAGCGGEVRGGRGEGLKVGRAQLGGDWQAGGAKTRTLVFS